MDQRLVEICFGTPDVPRSVDLEDEGSVLDHFVLQLCGDEDPDDPGASNAGIRAAVRAAVTRQLLGSDPFGPGVETAIRLLDDGFPAEDVLRQLCAATLASIIEAMGSAVGLDPVDADDDEVGLARLLVGGHELPAMYAALPLPSVAEIRRSLVDAVRRTPGGGIEELLDEAATDLDVGDRGPEIIRTMLEQMSDRLIEAGRLTILYPDRLADPSTVLADAVTTHRITEDDRDSGLTLFDDDLVTLVPPMNESGQIASELELMVDLSDLPAGTVVSLAVDGWSIAARPVPADAVGFDTADEELLRVVRDCYEIEHSESGLAVDLDDLVVAVALAEPGVWTRPHPPLTEIVAAAGLELRRGLVAGDAATWRYERKVAIEQRLLRAVDLGTDEGRQLVRILDEVLGGDTDGEPRLTRSAVAALRDPERGPLLVEALVELDGLAADEADVAELLDSLLEHARRDDERVLAHWLASMFEERRGRLEAAEQHVHEAFRIDPTWNPIVERMGWFAFLRGDAVTALQHWRRLGRAKDREMALAERFGNPASSRLGRNDPCWCGSGRKFKACHQGVVESAVLADRVDWLWAKAIGFMLRRGDSAIDDLAELCTARVEDPNDESQLQAAFEDPIVLDTALVEYEWFDQFLDEAGALLPADELALARSWRANDRSVFEVVERVDDRTVLHDVRSGESCEIRGGLPGRSVTVGDRWSARVVSDGSGHQLVGGAFRVPAGREDEVLDLLENGAPEELCEWLRDESRSI
jgi:SEC-C motif